MQSQKLLLFILDFTCTKVTIGLEKAYLAQIC